MRGPIGLLLHRALRISLRPERLSRRLADAGRAKTSEDTRPGDW